MFALKTAARQKIWKRLSKRYTIIKGIWYNTYALKERKVAYIFLLYFFGAYAPPANVAQQVVRFTRNEQVAGSSPAISSKKTDGTMPSVFLDQ